MHQPSSPRRSSVLAWTAAAAAAIVPSAAGQDSMPGDGHVAVRVLLDHDALSPGSEATVGVLLNIAPEWHVYWRNSGDTGMPVRVEFEAAPGVTIGPVLWPAPKRYQSSPEAVDYIFEKQLLLMAPVHVDPSARVDSSVTIRASVDFLVCRESCLPGAGSGFVTVPIASTPTPAAKHAPLFTEWRSRLPLPADASQVSTRWDGLTLVLSSPGAERLEFFPYEPEEPAPVSALEDGAAQGEGLRMRFPQRIVHAERVAGVVSVTKGGRTTAYEVSAPAPVLR